MSKKETSADAAAWIYKYGLLQDDLKITEKKVLKLNAKIMVLESEVAFYREKMREYAEKLSEVTK